MATKKEKKKKDLTITNPYAFFTKGRSKKSIEMDYSMKAKPPSSKEKRVNRTDYPGENFYYLEFFKKHNMAPPKKATKKSSSKKKTSNLIPKELIPFAKKAVEFETVEDFVKWWGNYKNELSSYNKTSKYPPAKIIGDLVKNGFHYDNWNEDLKTFYKVAKTEFPKTTTKKTTSKKKISEPQITEKEQKKYRDYYYVDVVYFTPKQFEKLEFLYETTLPNKKDKAYCYMSADENSDEYNFYLFFNKNRQEAYQISNVQMLNFNDPSDKERKERVDRFTDIAAKLYKEKNKIETSETTKKVSKKTPVKKSTTKISNPKDYPTLMAMRVKEKIIKDHNRCDFTKEEIEEAVDLSIRRGNETQGQIVKDAINILFATSKGH